MQELDIQPTNPTPYTPAGGMYNNNPQPGSGGLPALSGLTRNVNPMAQQLQDQGRGEDSVLVHMTPGEVNSLRGLAQKFGGDLTTNPNTGLPEAGWLGKLLPTILGAAGMLIPGAAPWMVAAGVGAGQTALTGDLGKGLMAGLQAFGGASLAGAAGVGGGAVPSVTPEAAANLAPGAATSAATSGLTIPADIAAMGTTAAAPVASTTLQAAAPTLGQTIASQAPTTLLAPGVGAPATPGFFSRFGAAASEGIKPGMLSKYAPYAAGLGTLSAVSDATAPDLREYEGEEDKWKYEGPYLPMPRRLRPTVTGGGEISFFENANPYPGYLPAGSTGYAEGGDTKTTTTRTDPFGANTANIKDWADTYRNFQRGLYGSHPSQEARMANEQKIYEALNTRTFANPKEYEDFVRSIYNPVTNTDTTTKVTGTTTPTSTRVTDTTTTTPAVNPQAGPSGYGVEALPTMYTPQFTSRPDFVTAAPRPATLGSRLAAQLPQFISQFQTSPGAITASRTYPGGSPSERIRAMAQANAAAAAASPTGEMNFGFKTPEATGNPYAPGGPMNMFSSDLLNRYLAEYGYAPINSTGTIQPHAKGGSIRMDDGAFVVDARTVSELGNGSSSAGQELLARLGGRPVKGPGDGVSDSIPANIGGTQEARVARDEVIIPADAVRKLGGAKKLYALMDKAHKARKKAKRGEDTKVAKGLGALA